MLATVLRHWGILALTAALLSGCAGTAPPAPEKGDLKPPEAGKTTVWHPEEVRPNHLALGRDLVKQGHYSVAMRQLNESLAACAEDPEPHTLLGICYRETGDLPEARRCFERAIALNETYAPAYNGLGITLFMLQEKASARRYLRRAVAINPADADYHNNLGVLEMQQNCLSVARSCFAQCLRITPDHIRAVNNMAECLVRLENDREALALLQRHFSPETAWNNLGAAYLKAGKTDTARRMFNKALAVDPGLAQARNNLDALE